MTHGALHARGCGVVAARDLGVEHLGHGVDDVHILHGEDDRLANVLITLDVRRHADLVDDGGHKAFQRDGAFLLRLPVPDGLTHPLEQRAGLAGLCHEVGRALLHCLHHHLLAVEGGNQDRLRPCRQLCHPVEQREAVQLRQDHVCNYKLRTFPFDHLPCLRAVPGAPHHVKFTRIFYRLLQHRAEIFVGIRQYDLDPVLHLPVPFPSSSILWLRQPHSDANRMFRFALAINYHIWTMFSSRFLSFSTNFIRHRSSFLDS